jgi:hypothetical protein
MDLTGVNVAQLAMLRTPQPEDWVRIKALVEDRYIGQRLTLSETVEEIRRQGYLVT